MEEQTANTNIHPFVPPIAIGICLALFDRFTLGGEITNLCTMFFLLSGSFYFGIRRTRKIWLWAILVTIWLPLIHMVGYAIGFKGNVHPDTFMARFMLLPVALIAGMVGGYAGAGIRGLLYLCRGDNSDPGIPA